MGSDAAPDRARRRGRRPVLVVVALASLVLAGCGLVAPGNAPVRVEATAETPPVRGAGDVADDPAIWHHPSDPSASRILATSKSDEGGLHVYDGTGTPQQFLDVGSLNNVDVRYDLPGVGDYAAATNRTDDTVTFFAIDDGGVTRAGGVTVPDEPYGLCLGVLDDRHHAVVTYKSGEVRQYVLEAATGEVTAELVRVLELSGVTEGCVVDDERGLLYLAEEARGIHRVELDPDDDPTLAVDIADGTLVPDVEGLTILDGDGGGYLLASSQGASRVDVFTRDDQQHLGAFQVAATGETDGIEVTSRPLAGFDQGMLVIHDGEPDGDRASNYKLVAWETIAGALDLPTAGGTTTDR